MYDENEVQVKNDCTSFCVRGGVWFGVIDPRRHTPLDYTDKNEEKE